MKDNDPVILTWSQYQELIENKNMLEWLVGFVLYESEDGKVRLDDRDSLATGWHDNWRDAIREAMKE